MPYGYPGYPGSTSSSVFHDQQEQPRLGLLDRLAGRLSDFGYGSGEEDKRAALRRALAAMGARMAGGALTEGTAAIAPAIAQGFAGYQQGLSDLNQQHRQEEGDRLQEEQLERQNRISDAQIENYEADNQRAADEAAARLQARKDLIAGRRAALEKLTPEQRARLEGINIGDEKFDDRLWEVTKPPEPVKPEGGFTLGEGQVRYGADGKVIATGPPKTRGAGSEKPAWYGVDYVTRGNQLVKIDKNTGSVTPVYTFEGGGADPIPQRRAIAKDQYDEIIGSWSPETYPEYIKKGTTDKPDLKKIWDDQWKFAGNYVGGKSAGPAAPAPGGGTRVSIPGDPEPNRPLEARVQDVAAAFGGKLPPAVLDQVRRDLRTKLPRDVVAQIRAAMGRR